MSVVDLQRRFRELGRIRMGEQRVSKNGKKYPAAIETFRFTSPSRGLLERMAEVVGGEVTAWPDAPAGDQWQLYSTSAEIAVVIPPTDEPYTQHYELWSGAGCQRRCTGEYAMVAQENGMRERPCVCKANGQEGEDRECKLTTRASFILPWAPGIGVFRLESHGYNAAVELTGTLAYLAHQAAQGVYIECRLRLDKREKRVPGQDIKSFVVPVLETDATPAELMAGAVSVPEIAPGPHGRPAIPAAVEEAPNGAKAAFRDPLEADPGPEGPPGWGSAPEPPSGEAARRAAPSEGDRDTRPISDAQLRRYHAIRNKAGVSDEQGKRIIASVMGQPVEGDVSSKHIERWAYEEVCDRVERGDQETLS